MKELERAKEVLKIEAMAITRLRGRLNKNFNRAIDILERCQGKIVVTGIGKPGIIGQKISATLASTGTPSLFLHPVEAIHGDLGRVTASDVVIAISNSGETEEITRLLPILKKIGASLISLTGNPRSTLARHSDAVLDIGVDQEACPFNLAPTASTTAALAMGDAVAIVLLERKGFRVEDYALFHPGGILGKKLLLRVSDIMRTGRNNPVAKRGMLVREVLLKITGARAGSASVVDRNGKLIGIFTDGDLRRQLEREPNLPNRRIEEVMTADPITVSGDRLAAEALRILQEKKIDEVPVVDKNRRPVGLLDVQDLLKAGLV